MNTIPFDWEIKTVTAAGRNRGERRRVIRGVGERNPQQVPWSEKFFKEFILHVIKTALLLPRIIEAAIFVSLRGQLIQLAAIVFQKGQRIFVMSGFFRRFTSCMQGFS